MSVRSIRPNSRSLTGRMPAGKGRGEACFESSLERDLLLILEFDPGVAAYETQPLEIVYRDYELRRRRYTPDVLVSYEPSVGRKELLCEVKFLEDLRANEVGYRERFKAASLHARRYGWNFRILTEREIRTPYLYNARFLLEYRHAQRRGECSESARVLLLESLRLIQNPTPQLVLDYIAKEPRVKAELQHTLWQLIASFDIQTDLSVNLNMRSRLWLPQG